MNLFKRKTTPNPTSDQARLAEVALRTIHDGVVMTDRSGVIQFINPAAVTMVECGSADKAVGLDYSLVIKIESKEGREYSEQENPLIQAMKNSQPLESAQVTLIANGSEKRSPIALSAFTVDGTGGDRIIVFRDIAKELAEEGEQTEFISTASHEMRTPVATIDGYLMLALNPQTATIDERARGYLTAAESASKHLGKLFQDLLDVTKLDDGKVKPRFEPIEMVQFVKVIADDYQIKAQESNIGFRFGPDDTGMLGSSRKLSQVVYSYIDPDFMREVMDNILDNAFKYTPEGGAIYVNVRGDGDKVLINVTDNGMGISADDLGHIFQKFYRADNSDTRTIGGTGLGLYLVKQRVEAMGGRVWAESVFGEGSTFYVSLPRLSSDEYEKRMIAVRNRKMQEQMMQAQQPAPPPTPIQPTPTAPPLISPQPTPPAPQPASATPSTPQPAPQPVPQPTPTPPTPQPAPQPVPQPTPTPPTPQPTPQPTQVINNNINGEVK